MPAKIDSSIAVSPASVPGILMKRLSRSALACSCAACSIVAAASSASSGETSSETKPSTPSVRSWTAAKRSAASRRSAIARPKKRSSVEPAPRRVAGDLLVVGVAGGDRLVEDGRVGGQPGDGQLVDVAAQGAVGEHRAGDVVEPEALADLVQLFGRFHAAPFESFTSSPGPGRAPCAPPRRPCPA